MPGPKTKQTPWSESLSQTPGAGELHQTGRVVERPLEVHLVQIPARHAQPGPRGIRVGPSVEAPEATPNSNCGGKDG